MSRACPAASLCQDSWPEDRGKQISSTRFLGLLPQLRLAGTFTWLGAVQDLGDFVVEPQSTLVLVEGRSLDGQLDGPDNFMQPFGFQTVDLSWRSWSVQIPLGFKLTPPCIACLPYRKGHVVVARSLLCC